MPVLCSNISSGGASSNSAALSSAIGGRGTTARRDVMIARRGGRYAAPEESSNLIFVPVSEPPTRSSHSSKNGSTIPSIQALPQKSKKTRRPRCARAFSSTRVARARGTNIGEKLHRSTAGAYLPVALQTRTGAPSSIHLAQKSEPPPQSQVLIQTAHRTSTPGATNAFGRSPLPLPFRPFTGSILKGGKGSDGGHRPANSDRLRRAECRPPAWPGDGRLSPFSGMRDNAAAAATPVGFERTAQCRRRRPRSSSALTRLSDFQVAALDGRVPVR